MATLTFTVDWIWNKGFQDQESPATDSTFRCQGEEGQQALLQQSAALLVLKAGALYLVNPSVLTLNVFSAPAGSATPTCLAGPFTSITSGTSGNPNMLIWVRCDALQWM